MSRAARAKGAKTERQLVTLHQDAGIPCEKISRSGYTGADLRIADEFLAEVKSRQAGQGFTTLERWLGTNDVLFLRRDRQAPFVILSWTTYEKLIKTYTRLDGVIVRE